MTIINRPDFIPRVIVWVQLQPLVYHYRGTLLRRRRAMARKVALFIHLNVVWSKPRIPF